MIPTPHTSVLAEAVLSLLAPKPGGVYCDGTLGAGGHTRGILAAAGPGARVIGIDRDRDAAAVAEQQLQDMWSQVTYVHGSFSDIDEHLRSVGVGAVDGLLIDIGVSSMQLDRAERGFSFGKPGPIDMRMDQSRGETALELIRRLSVPELTRILRDFGEERFAPRIASVVKQAAVAGELSDTSDLANAVANCIPAKARRNMRIHPATLTFQALRIAVNEELAELERFLEVFPSILKPGGRCVVLSFHSLEDRMVKRRFRDLAKTSGLPPDLARKAGERVHPICNVLTKRPVVADDDEIARNPRARSAKLRACEKAVVQ